MKDALLNLGTGQKTNERHLVAIDRASKFNRLLGGPFVAPWSLDDLPDEWIETLDGLAYDLPKVQAWHTENLEALARVRSKKVQ